jgi:hypothetical protein
MSNQDILNPIKLFVEHWRQYQDAAITLADVMALPTHRVIMLGLLREELGPYRRLLVPALSGWGHLPMFMDHRATITCDLNDLFRQAKQDPHRAVYVPEQEMDSPWPSFMLFRAKYCERLTPMYLQRATPDDVAPKVWAGGAQNVGTLTGIRVSEVWHAIPVPVRESSSDRENLPGGVV